MWPASAQFEADYNVQAILSSIFAGGIKIKLTTNCCWAEMQKHGSRRSALSEHLKKINKNSTEVIKFRDTKCFCPSVAQVGINSNKLHKFILSYTWNGRRASFCLLPVYEYFLISSCDDYVHYDNAEAVRENNGKEFQKSRSKCISHMHWMLIE